MVIPEYGRNVQKMIDHAIDIEDAQERNKCAQSNYSSNGSNKSTA